MSKSTTSSNPVQIGLTVSGEVEIDDNIDGLNVDSSCA